MTATIDLTITPIQPAKPADRKPCQLADPCPGDDGCQHPSGSCKPEGCSAC